MNSVRFIFSFWVFFFCSLFLFVPGTYAACQKAQTSTSKILVGSLDHITSDGVVEGWAVNLDTPNDRLNVDIYINGPIGAGKLATTRITKLARPDVNQTYGIKGTHGYQWGIPEQYRDGQAHCLYAYIAGTQTQKVLLQGSPKEFIFSPNWTPTPQAYESIGGAVQSNDGKPLAGIIMSVRLAEGVVRETLTDANGRYALSDFVPHGKSYSVTIAGNADDPYFAPQGYAGPGKTSNSTQSYNSCLQSNQATYSTSYECQQAGIRDCGSANTCNFVFFPSRVDSCSSIQTSSEVLSKENPLTITANAKPDHPVRELWFSFYNLDKPSEDFYGRRVAFEPSTRFIMRKIFNGEAISVSTSIKLEDIDKRDLNFLDINGIGQKPVTVGVHAYVVNRLGQFSTYQQECSFVFHIPTHNNGAQSPAYPKAPETVVTGRVQLGGSPEVLWKNPATDCRGDTYLSADTMNISGYTLSECDGGGPLYISRPIDNETQTLELLDVPAGYQCSQWSYSLFNIQKGSWETIASGPGCKMTGTFTALPNIYSNVHHVWFTVRKIATEVTPTLAPYCVRNTWTEELGYNGNSWCAPGTQNCDTGWVFLPKVQESCPFDQHLVSKGMLCTRWDLAKWFRGSVECKQ